MFESRQQRAEWEMIYEKFNWEPGNLITFYELSEILGRNFLNCRTPIYRVKKEITANHGLVLKSERMVGYSVINPEENREMAIYHGKKGKRQINKANFIIRNTDLNKLSSEGRILMEILDNNISRLSHQMAFLGRRQTAAVQRVDQRVDNHAQDIADMKNRLAELEIKILGQDKAA